MTAADTRIDGAAAWRRLVLSLAAMTIGSSAMYVVSVVLPTVQAEFGVARADASLPYTAMMLGFGVGGVVMGALADRHGVKLPLSIGSLGLVAGFLLASRAESIAAFALVHGVLMGLMGASATFAPLVADTALWFQRRRGIAVAICASGNYLAGTVWPPIVQHLVATIGWRTTYVVLAGVCAATLPVLAWLLRERPPGQQPTVVTAGAAAPAPGAVATVPSVPSVPAGSRPFGMSPAWAQGWLCVAGVACCVAMSMPQVHIVAYCGDMGYGAARGAQMLSLMLGFGIVSRLAFGAISDRIGGLRTLLLGSSLQGVALLLFIPFDSVASLYLISALFGLFQGGIVPSYAIVVREHFPAATAGARSGAVLSATLLGMALGGWLSGKVFDWSGSYTLAFVNGVGWNLLNLAIVFTLWRRLQRKS